ncbi:deoxynucleoside kinase [Candidatus Dependentiae bacterium]
MKSNKTIFFLEGNIGAGKSIFLKILKDNLNVDICFEPINKWQDIENEGNILDLFHKNTKRWAYTFQSYTFISRIQYQIEEEISCKKDTQIFERSVYCDRYCFAKNCYESGNITSLEWQIYKEWFSWLIKKHTKKPSAFIYLKTDPKVCLARLKKRNCSQEACVELSYLELLHKNHEDWLVKKICINNYISDVPILVLDCDQDFESNLDIQKEHIKSVEKFIENIKKNDISGEIQ